MRLVIQHGPRGAARVLRALADEIEALSGDPSPDDPPNSHPELVTVLSQYRTKPVTTAIGSNRGSHRETAA